MGLLYVRDDGPGITRRCTSSGPQYIDVRGRRIRDAKEIARLNALAVPPAYRSVWICPDPRGHIQATGRDARGRKQYRYHERWREVRDATKYGRMMEFGRALPRIRRRVARDLARTGMPRAKVLATVLRLLETTLIRIGNEEYARANRSYGLTTMQTRHVAVNGHELRFSFRGKGGREHTVRISDRRLARVVRQCMDIPGHELFQYLDEDGLRHAVDSADVNAYLREAAHGNEFTAKDYRTWAGSVYALALFRARDEAPSGEPRQRVNAVVREVAARLGNTPAICRRCYLHPAVIESFVGDALDAIGDVRTPALLTADEARFLALLRKAGRGRKRHRSAA